MNLDQWFEQGMTGQAYIDSMEVNREALLEIYRSFQPQESEAYFSELANRRLRGIVLTADWCGDAMMCVPIVMRIAEKAGIEMRYLIRDENLELMDQYLTNGKSRSIPIFIFIDDKGEERVVWGPRAPEVQTAIDAIRAQLPSSEDPMFKEKQRALYKDFRQQLLEKREWWQAVERSLKERFQERMG
ncbi:thioredoxin family protein [Desmospora activa]|uniref:Thiol-disulfide isomerase/thioredoxin n=1 Tax=Desmospora activa DSM 45169 TaxID=1121389 RepID=A0A2T4Z0I7_9BACL|nr:thioredoxin family protein [Desmospora activa]PTM53264.1 thiol-disulfide isomerase/thioredoxin [Desmospora activa DSM 45169]